LTFPAGTGLPPALQNAALAQHRFRQREALIRCGVFQQYPPEAAVIDTKFLLQKRNHFRILLVTTMLVCRNEWPLFTAQAVALRTVVPAPQKALLESLDSQLEKLASFKPLKRLCNQNCLK
jgi:hypothetical protein